MYKLFFILIVFVILDIVYLNVSKDYYEKEMNIKYSNVQVIPAIVAWACITFSYYYIVQEPFENKYLRGVVLAVGMYGVYNSTNLAIFPNYSQELAIRDTLWGTTLITAVTLIIKFQYENN